MSLNDEGYVHETVNHSEAKLKVGTCSTTETYYLYFTCSAFSCVSTLDNTNEIHLFTIPTKCQNQSENRCHSPA